MGYALMGIARQAVIHCAKKLAAHDARRDSRTNYYDTLKLEDKTKYERRAEVVLGAYLEWLHNPRSTGS
jgi:hypothetical protein